MDARSPANHQSPWLPFETRRRARDEKREAVLRTAVALFLEQGYHRTTLNDVAERLNLVRVSVPPFSAIDAESEEACRRLMLEADLLVVCDAPIGPGNVANLGLALETARSGVHTVLREQIPIEERDFTGGEATATWSELRSVATVIRSYEELELVLG